MVRGRHVKVGGDPTPTVRIPWNSLTCVLTSASGASDLTIQDIRDAVQNQLGFGANQHFELKIHAVKCWGPVAPTDGTGDLILAVADLLDDSDGFFEPIAVLRDAGTLASRAAVGYVWPLAQQENVIITTSAAKQFVLQTENAVLFYVDLLWKPRFVDNLRAWAQKPVCIPN